MCVIVIFVMPTTLQVEAIATTEVGSYLYTGRLYVIQNVHSGKFLEVANGNLSSGTNVWQDTFNFDANLAQVFSLVLVSFPNQSSTINGRYYYKFVPIGNTDLCLDLDNAYDANGTNIKVFTDNPDYSAQYFSLLPNADGSFCIEPYLCYESERVLTVANDSTSNQANVELGDKDSNNPSQRWVFKEIDPLNDPELINLNWSYFFRGDAGTTYRRIYQRLNLSNEDWHNGTDFPADVGTPIYSPCAGVVVARGVGESTMGNYVMIRTTETIETSNGEKQLTIRLLHMSQPPNVVYGQQVTTSTLLGYVGNTGLSKGEHLHIDVNVGNKLSGNDFIANPSILVNVEKLYLSKRFRYGSELVRIYATDVVY